MVDFLTINSAVNPFVYHAVGAEGSETDADGDGNRDLDGVEYEATADEIIIPRFLGQGLLTSHSQLTLIGLTGGSQFATTIDFLVYNDNEEVFSSEYTFECWDKVYLGEISGVFWNDFLADNTNNDPNEMFGFPIVETGWIWMNGALASSSTTSIQDPAFLAVLNEGLRGLRGADLPFQRGTQTNGSLLPHSLDGQN